MWVLGQADVAEKRKLADFLVAGAKVIRLTIERRGHPDYDSGALQFFPTKGALGACRLVSFSVEPRTLNEKDPTAWLGLDATLQTVEYSNIDTDSFEDAEYAEIDIDLNTDDPVTDFIDIDTRYSG